MELNIQTAELALREASEANPGAWADHSRFVAKACKNIASHCKDLSSEQWSFFIWKAAALNMIRQEGK